jgi:hypothetical protein
MNRPPRSMSIIFVVLAVTLLWVGELGELAPIGVLSAGRAASAAPAAASRPPSAVDPATDDSVDPETVTRRIEGLAAIEGFRLPGVGVRWIAEWLDDDCLAPYPTSDLVHLVRAAGFRRRGMMWRGRWGNIIDDEGCRTAGGVTAGVEDARDGFSSGGDGAAEGATDVVALANRFGLLGPGAPLPAAGGGSGGSARGGGNSGAASGGGDGSGGGAGKDDGQTPPPASTGRPDAPEDFTSTSPDIAPPVVTPEPGTALLVGSALAGLGGGVRLFRRRSTGKPSPAPTSR